MAGNTTSIVGPSLTVLILLCQFNLLKHNEKIKSAELRLNNNISEKVIAAKCSFV